MATDPASFTENVTFTGNSGYDKVEEFGLDEIIEDVADVSALENAIAQAAEGSDIQIDLTANAAIKLGSGMIALPENAGTITINGNGATISADTQYFFNSKPSLNNDGLGKDAVLIIRNVNFVGAGGGYAAVIGPTEVGHTQVTLENCSFTNMYCAVYAGQMEAGAVLDLTIRNCTYTNTQYGYSIYKGYPDYASVTVNVVFEGNTGVTDEEEF